MAPILSTTDNKHFLKQQKYSHLLLQYNNIYFIRISRPKFAKFEEFCVLKICYLFSLRASSRIFWPVKRVSRERTSEGQRKGELVTIPYKFSFVLRPDEGKYHWLKSDVLEIKVD